MHEDDTVDRRAARLSALLRASDPPAPPLAFPAERIARARQRRVVVRWRLAAGIAFLLAGAAFVQPLRAWFVTTARHFFLGAAKAAPAAPAAAADSAAAPVVPVPSNVVTFTPRSGVFVVELAVRQQGGTIQFARVLGGSASAAIMGDPGDAELLVRPEGLRIGNHATARADYVVRVPAGVARVSLRIGREPVRPVRLTSEYDVQVPIGPRTDRPE